MGRWEPSRPELGPILINAYLLGGLDLRELARQARCDRTELSEWLRAQGVALRPRGGFHRVLVPPGRMQELAAEYRAGASLRTLAQREGIGRTHLITQLRHMGVVLRDPSEAATTRWLRWHARNPAVAGRCPWCDREMKPRRTWTARAWVWRQHRCSAPRLSRRAGPGVIAIGVPGMAPTGAPSYAVARYMASAGRARYPLP